MPAHCGIVWIAEHKLAVLHSWDYKLGGSSVYRKHRLGVVHKAHLTFPTRIVFYRYIAIFG